MQLDSEKIKQNMRFWSETATENSLVYGDVLTEGIALIEKLEKELADTQSRLYDAENNPNHMPQEFLTNQEW